MSRLLFLAAVAVVIYWLLQSRRVRPSGDTGGKVEDMVRCAYCGVHLPKGESLLADGKYYCSESHRRASAEPSSQD